MIPHNLLYVRTREEWRIWLEQNFDKENDVWLVSPKISTGISRIPYNDTVEEALCFGWIDSTNKSLDQKHTAQRFTPRRPKSSFSQANVERLRWLEAQNLIHPSLVKEIREILSREFVFPADILEVLQEDKSVWDHYQAFPGGYRRIRIAYIDGARKRPQEFARRLSNFIEKTWKNQLITGYGGIEKYYFND